MVELQVDYQVCLSFLMLSSVGMVLYGLSRLVYVLVIRRGS